MVISALTLTACGNQTIQESSFDKEINSFVENRGKVINTPIRFTDDCEEKDATCRNGVITVNPSYWNNHNDVERKIIIWRALGVCELGRVYTDETINLGPWTRHGQLTRPTSLMSRDILIERLYLSFQNEYDEELFFPNGRLGIDPQPVHIQVRPFIGQDE